MASVDNKIVEIAYGKSRFKLNVPSDFDVIEPEFLEEVNDPKLAIEKNLTKESSDEQSQANLKNCTEEEYDEFKVLNNEYEKKFGFPFIIAVKGKDKIEILNNFRQRINNDVEFEFKEAKSQVKKIALFRLNEIFTK